MPLSRCTSAQSPLFPALRAQSSSVPSIHVRASTQGSCTETSNLATSSSRNKAWSSWLTSAMPAGCPPRSLALLLWLRGRRLHVDNSALQVSCCTCHTLMCSANIKQLGPYWSALTRAPPDEMMAPGGIVHQSCCTAAPSTLRLWTSGRWGACWQSFWVRTCACAG